MSSPSILQEKRIDHTGYSKKRSGFWPPSFFFLFFIFHVYLLEWLASKVECSLCLLRCDFLVRGTSYGVPIDRSRCSERSRMDRNDNDTLGELLVSRPSRKHEPLLLAFVSLVDESYSSVEFRIKDKKIKKNKFDVLMIYRVISFIVSQIYFLFFHFLFEIFHHKDRINIADDISSIKISVNEENVKSRLF